MTEEQIERRVEFMVDELDRLYTTTAMTSDHYELRMKQIDAWAARALRNSLNLGKA
jgi:hypothetical protein